MPRLDLAFCLTIAASAARAPLALAAPPPRPAPAAGSISPPATDPLSLADAARRAGRWAEAADAYKAALEAAERERAPVERRARIAGELGMCEIALERYPDAADHLAFATSQPPEALTPEQQRRFLRGLEKAEAQVATITISANPVDAEVLIDGKPIGYVAPTYQIHVLPGDHVVRGRLAGHAGDEGEVSIPRGGSAVVSLRLREVVTSPPAASPTPLLRQPPPAATSHVGPAPEAVVPDASVSEQRLPYGLHSGLSLVPLVSMGFSPGVSAGMSFDVMFPLGQGSFNLELRALASQETYGGALVATLAGRTQLSGCGYRGDYSLCLVLAAGGIEVLKDPTIKEIDIQKEFSGSVGIRPGAEWAFTDHLVLRVFGEIHAVIGHPSIWVNRELAWAGPPVAGFLGIGGMYSLQARGKDDDAPVRRGSARLH